ncbi:hypothetical protein NW762_006460 [Fusarium torreyae]|uniref:Uncharacterized protein n=1 Tax=Fusarium torreyae TaxID=1237075 RepID=A0A9W8S0H1_9HYPO|nr:hypothetical protein NW762_006460 [Fusarium torreyae]
MDSYPIPDEGEHGPKKGGHSLRKRARVDYTFEHIDDDVVVPNSTSSARGKKRRSEVNFDTDDFYGTDSKRRGASMGADTPSNRRRNPSRKSSEMKAYHQAALQDDDNDVQDTIEVGAYYSDASDSELRETVGSNHSSPQSKMSPKNSPRNSPKNESTKTEPAAPQIDDSHQLEPPTGNTTAAPETEEIPPEQVLPVVEPTSNSIEEPVSQPAEPQTEQLPKVEPEPEVLNPNAKQIPQVADFNNAAPTLEPEAAPEIESVPEPIAMSVPEPEPESAPEAEAVPVPVLSSAPAPAPAPVLVTADENNKNELIHSPIEPASEPEPVNGVSGVPTAEFLPQDNSTSFNTNHIIIKGETDHHSTFEQAPESPDQPSNQQQEDKMDIDLAQEEHLAQDVEMTDAVLPDTQEPALTPASAVLSSPLPSKAPSMSPPKSPSKSPAPSPAREIEQPHQIADDTTASLQLSAPEIPTPVEVNDGSMEIEEENNESENNNSGPAEVSATANEAQAPDSSQIPVTQEEPVTISSPTEIKAPTPPPADTIETPASSAPSETKSSPQKPAAPRPGIESMPQPTPVGRWAYLKPYVDGEFVLYPEKKGRSDEDGATDDATPEGKDTDREGVDMEPMVDDQDDTADGAALEAPTPALNTPTRGSPVPDSTDLTAFNSPAPGGEDADDADVSESQELPERSRYFKYRKLRDPEEYISAIENYEDMSTDELYEILEAINVSMVQWQHEWNDLGVIVDDYENSLRRRAADAKYEARTRNLHQHGINYEEPEFAVKGYKSRDKEGVNETRYLQGQDRIMAASYGFEYDPHPSKIGKQNPETQQVGIMTRGRSLRNQPRQTAKATETDEVVGKRQRKPVQLFDPATQDVSRSSTPVPTRGGGRRRKNANPDDDAQTNLSVSFNEIVSDGEGTGPKTRRKRGTRGKNAVPNITEDLVPTPDAEEDAAQEEPTKSTRRSRARPVKYEEADPNEFVDDEPQEEEEEEEEEKEEKLPVRRHLLTLKLPKGYLNEPTSEIEITDNGDSRPTTASSEESSHTAESSYSFRPKRQKRFRDDPDETEESAQAPPKKRGKRTSGVAATNDVPSAASTPAPSAEPVQVPNNRKIQKIKVVRSGQDSKNGGAPPPPPPPPPPVPMVEEGDDTPKDYKSMTKSEKMSASMKNRWANGNMAGAVEKRKATLAAKKAAQAAAEQRTGVVAPKPKGKAAVKRDATLKMQMQPDQPQVPPQQQPLLHQPPPMHPHQHQHQHQHQHHQHQHQHPPHPLHLQQQPPMHQPHPQHIPPPPPPPPPHQAGNPPPFMHGHNQHHNHGHNHGMPGMGYPY